MRKCSVVGLTLEGHHHGCDLGARHEGFHVCFICRGTFQGSDCYSEQLAAIRKADHPASPGGPDD